MAGPRNVLGLLWASALTLVVGLTGHVFFLHEAARTLETNDVTITENTAPSIIALEGMNVHLARLRQRLFVRLRGPPGARGGDGGIRAELLAIERTAARYEALPVDPGEAEIIDDLRGALQRLERATGRVLAFGATSDALPPQVVAEVDGSCEAVNEALIRASTLNADVATDATRAVHATAARLVPTALVLGVLVGGAASIAIGAAYQLRRQEAELGERRLLLRKNAELEAFSAQVAHDLLSPLMGVSLAIARAEHRLAAPEDECARVALSRAGASLVRVRHMVKDLLDFARAAARPPPGARTDVEPILEGVFADLEPVAAEAGVDLRRTGEACRGVACASGVLSSVLANLVTNGIQHARGPAEHGASGASVEVRTLDVGGDVHFEVEDTGPGIAPEDRERMFEPYLHPGRDVGQGLGLATVKRLAEAHGGGVGVRSEAGHGALFWVNLPAAP